MISVSRELMEKDHDHCEINYSYFSDVFFIDCWTVAIHSLQQAITVTWLVLVPGLAHAVSQNSIPWALIPHFGGLEVV